MMISYSIYETCITVHPLANRVYNMTSLLRMFPTLLNSASNPVVIANKFLSPNQSIERRHVMHLSNSHTCCKDVNKALPLKRTAIGCYI